MDAGLQRTTRGAGGARAASSCATPRTDRSADRQAAQNETARLRPKDVVEVQWDQENGTTAWYPATILRHLGAHGHVGITVEEIPDRFLDARGFVIEYQDEPGERNVMIASDGLLLDTGEGISMHWRPQPKKTRRRVIRDDDDLPIGAL